MEPDASIVIEHCERVYPPREDSWLLVRAVAVERGEKVLDMGAGTGVLGLHCAKAGAHVTSADIDPAAVACVRRNAAANGLDVEAVQSDLFDGLDAEWDIVAFNPPYLRTGGEGETALDGGAQGDELSLRFIADVKRHLAPGGRVYLLRSSAGRRDRLDDSIASSFKPRIVAEENMFFERLWVEELTSMY